MLALNGGTPVNTKKFIWRSTIDEQDEQAALEVIKGKDLSGFYGSPGPRFLGGPKVKELDKVWADYFEVKYAASVNSATSGLYAAVAALGIGPGDEVIVAPLSMAISAVCVLAYGAIPVFADLEPDYFCLDPKSVEEKISENTKAIIVVDLLGGAADLDPIMDIAKRHNLKVIEDNAQAPGALYKGRKVGTIADIGVFSLNCHKAVQTGEGGVVVTNSEEYARKIQLIRNHAESVVESGKDDLVNMLGWNYRLTEIQAAIGIIQLSKLKAANDWKVERAQYFNEVLSQFSFLQTPKVRPDCTHVYYLYMLKYDSSVLGVDRNTFVKALNAEGYGASFGYVKPIYLLPVFQEKIAIGRDGWPFTSSERGKAMKYEKGLCPVAEKHHFEQMFYPDLIRYEIDKTDIDTFATAISKVAEHSSVLKAA
ncbi:MAG: DegT/DnrJ/EryC1/StrS family aminotransferase [Bdellovibrionota bacterium]